jgi:hypothetical protein
MPGVPGASRRSSARRVRANPAACRAARDFPDLTFSQGMHFQTGGFCNPTCFCYIQQCRVVVRPHRQVAQVLQQSLVDVYLNGAQRFAQGNFVRARDAESGILNDHGENNSICGTPRVGGDFVAGHPA